jgi:hypothetical protein
MWIRWIRIRIRIRIRNTGYSEHLQKSARPVENARDSTNKSQGIWYTEVQRHLDQKAIAVCVAYPAVRAGKVG